MIKKSIVTLLVLISIITLAKINSQFEESQKQNPNKIRIMTYNLENLFDTLDDPNKNDETFLPKNKKTKQILKICEKAKTPAWRSECKDFDWSEKALDKKMQRLSDVILKSNNGFGPDIAIFQEVENLKVIDELRIKYLKNYYVYTPILIEGEDNRGIDVAILSKLPKYQEPKLHQIKFKPQKGLAKAKIPKTRGILEASFLLPNKTPIYVFGVHFPSQSTPTEARTQALAQLITLIKTKPKSSLIVAGGDFNITKYEENKYKMLSKYKNDVLVSHLVGCHKCKGTNYFHPKRSWSFLDVLLFSNNFKNKNSDWALNVESINVFNQSIYQNNKWGNPMKFNLGKEQQGVSDHWPVYADIELNSSRSNGTFK